MTGKRRKRIIAVFGGSSDPKVLGFSEKLGRAIADERQILLTGGTGPDCDSVKNSAYMAATGKTQEEVWDEFDPV